MTSIPPLFRRSLLGLALFAPLALANASPIELTPTQFWQYGANASGRTMTTTPLGQLFVGGDFLDTIDHQKSHGGSDVFVTLFSSRGERLWTRVLGGDDNDYIGATTADDNGNLYVTGTTAGNLGGDVAGSFDVFISRMDTDGAIVWTRQFGSSDYERPLAITTDAAGNIYVAGYSSGQLGDAPALGGLDMFLASFDADGKQRWLRQFGTAESDIASALVVIGETIYLAGNSRGRLDGAASNNKPDVVLRAFDSSGEPLWAKQFGTVRPDYAVALGKADNGDLLLAGYSYGELEALTNRGDADVFVARFSQRGEPRWLSGLGSEKSDIPKAMSIGRNGMLLVAGYTHGNLTGDETHGLYDAFTAAWSADGELLGVSQFGKRGFNQANAIAATPTGELFVLGDAASDLDDDPTTGEGRIFLAAIGNGATEREVIDGYPPNVILKRNASGYSGIAGDSEDIDLDGISDSREDMNSNGIIDFRGEDRNGDGLLAPEEDIDSDGRMNRDTGLASITLDPASDNLTLEVPPFARGALHANFTISRSDTSRPGKGRLIVRDAGGNETIRDIDIGNHFCANTQDLVHFENSGAIHFPNWASSPRDAEADYPADTLWITRTDNPALFRVLPHVSYPSWSLAYTLQPDTTGNATVWYEVVDYATGGKRYYCGEESFRISVLPETPTPVDPAPAPRRIQVVSGESTEIDLLEQARASGEISAISQPSHGEVTLAGNTATYRSLAGYTGPDAFSYWVRDEHGAETAHRLPIDVIPDGDSAERERPRISVKGDDDNRHAASGGAWHWGMSLLLAAAGWRRKRGR